MHRTVCSFLNFTFTFSLKHQSFVLRHHWYIEEWRSKHGAVFHDNVTYYFRLQKYLDGTCLTIKERHSEVPAIFISLYFYPKQNYKTWTSPTLYLKMDSSHILAFSFCFMILSSYSIHDILQASIILKPSDVSFKKLQRFDPKQFNDPHSNGSSHEDDYMTLKHFQS